MKIEISNDSVAIVYCTARRMTNILAEAPEFSMEAFMQLHKSLKASRQCLNEVRIDTPKQTPFFLWRVGPDCFKLVSSEPKSVDAAVKYFKNLNKLRKEHKPSMLRNTSRVVSEGTETRISLPKTPRGLQPYVVKGDTTGSIYLVLHGSTYLFLSTINHALIPEDKLDYWNANLRPENYFRGPTLTTSDYKNKDIHSVWLLVPSEATTLHNMSDHAKSWLLHTNAYSTASDHVIEAQQVTRSKPEIPLAYTSAEGQDGSVYQKYRDVIYIFLGIVVTRKIPATEVSAWHENLHPTRYFRNTGWASFGYGLGTDKMFDPEEVFDVWVPVKSDKIQIQDLDTRVSLWMTATSEYRLTDVRTLHAHSVL